MLWMFKPAFAMALDIWPTMLGTLALATATRYGDSRPITTSGKLTAFRDLPERMRLLPLRGQAPRGVDRDLGVVAEHVHPELDRRVGDQAPDLAEADDAERLLRQLDARELLLLRLYALGKSLVVAVERAHQPDRRNQIARRHQHPGEHQLLHRVRARAGGVEHRHAAPAHVLHLNIARAGARAADRANAVGNLHRVHILRAHQNRVG